MTLEELSRRERERIQQSLDRARNELSEQLRRSKEEGAQFYDELAAMAHEAGHEQAAARYQREAARERSRPLPNAA